jgi:hypothetical protein
MPPILLGRRKVLFRGRKSRFFVVVSQLLSFVQRPLKVRVSVMRSKISLDVLYPVSAFSPASCINPWPLSFCKNVSDSVGVVV